MITVVPRIELAAFKDLLDILPPVDNVYSLCAYVNLFGNIDMSSVSKQFNTSLDFAISSTGVCINKPTPELVLSLHKSDLDMNDNSDWTKNRMGFNYAEFSWSILTEKQDGNYPFWSTDMKHGKIKITGWGVEIECHGDEPEFLKDFIAITKKRHIRCRLEHTYNLF